MYEEKIDVRPIISKFLGYFVLIALPPLTIVSVYSYEYVVIFSSNPNFYDAYKLIPYLAFGVFFMAITDFTTLQYSLAKKTYINFIIKLISGIACVILNIVLIPKFGLIGVGAATLIANLLYFLLSIIIVLPGFSLIYPSLTLVRIIISFIPTMALYYMFTQISTMLAAVEMLSLACVFYVTYYILAKTVLKRKKA